MSYQKEKKIVACNILGFPGRQPSWRFFLCFFYLRGRNHYFNIQRENVTKNDNSDSLSTLNILLNYPLKLGLLVMAFFFKYSEPVKKFGGGAFLLIVDCLQSSNSTSNTSVQSHVANQRLEETFLPFLSSLTDTQWQALVQEGLQIAGTSTRSFVTRNWSAVHPIQKPSSFGTHVDD